MLNRQKVGLGTHDGKVRFEEGEDVKERGSNMDGYRERVRRVEEIGAATGLKWYLVG